MPSTLHCMARLFNRWELLSALLDNPVVTVAMYVEQPTIHQEHQLEICSIISEAFLFSAWVYTDKRYTFKTPYIRVACITDNFTKGSTLNHSFNQCGTTKQQQLSSACELPLIQLVVMEELTALDILAPMVSLTYV